MGVVYPTKEFNRYLGTEEPRFSRVSPTPAHRYTPNLRRQNGALRIHKHTRFENATEAIHWNRFRGVYPASGILQVYLRAHRPQRGHYGQLAIPEDRGRLRP